MSFKEIKKLSFFRRPWFAKKVIEIGGGHAPYDGVTHAVDLFPGDTHHRAHAYHLPEGVTFRQGDLENVPFDEKFDFLYASHVLEHVNDPKKAVGEINRLTPKGYIETPTPVWEQLNGPKTFDPDDIHKFYVWTTGSELNVISKIPITMNTYCNCERGQFVKRMVQTQDAKKVSLEPLISSRVRSIRYYFTAPIKLNVYKTFQEACDKGHCAYACVDVVRNKMKLWPLSALSKRTRQLHGYLKTNLT